MENKNERDVAQWKEQRMNSAQIRAMVVPMEHVNQLTHLEFIGTMVREIAAQLAEFNERCKERCEPPVQGEKK